MTLVNCKHCKEVVELKEMKSGKLQGKCKCGKTVSITSGGKPKFKVNGMSTVMSTVL